MVRIAPRAVNTKNPVFTVFPQYNHRFLQHIWSFMSARQYSLVDELIIGFDRGLTTLFKPTRVRANREYPAADIMENPLSATEKHHSAGLMRVNHSGEVSAQALYQGQALTARDSRVRHSMRQSAREEVDHLAWCEQRIIELDGHTSLLNPVWYIGSLTIGAVAGICGDKWSLGFITETERQVVNHLQDHLDRLPDRDEKSRAILQQMQIDEGHHATVALEAGAAELPGPVKHLMRLASKVMTTSAYRM